MKELYRKLKVHAFFAAVVVLTSLSYIADKLRIRPALTEESEI